MNLDARTEQLMARLGVLSLAIKEKVALFTAYRPYIQGRGLFIPTSKPFQMGDEVFMLLSLLNDLISLKTISKIIWILPLATSGRPQGVGCRIVKKIVVK